MCRRRIQRHALWSLERRKIDVPTFGPFWAPEPTQNHVPHYFQREYMGIDIGYELHEVFYKEAHFIIEHQQYTKNILTCGSYDPDSQPPICRPFSYLRRLEICLQLMTNEICLQLMTNETCNLAHDDLAVVDLAAIRDDIEK
jgi:hypothetical protein